MRRFSLFVPVVAIAASLVSTVAVAEPPSPAAQAPCKPWREVAQYLGERYSEHPVAVGLQSDGSLLQVFAAPGTSTWTLVSMRPDGMACLIGAGKAWELLKVPNPDPAA